MAFFYNANQAPSTGSVAMFSFKEQLKVVNWAVKSSADATSFSTNSDLITSGATGANGFANTNAWIRLQCPSMGGVARELIIQRGTTNLLWRIKYSYSAGFTGGSPSATQTPSSTDQQFICGGGTEAAPTFGTIFGADAGYKYHCAAADGADGYMFYSVAYAHNAGALSHIMFMDQMQSDSVNSLDTDGYVFYANTITGTLTGIHGHSVATTVGGPQSWLRKGLTGETFVRTPACQYSTFNTVGGTIIVEQTIGINSFDGKDTGLPAIYIRLSAEVGTYSGFKGIGRLFKFASSTRSNGTPLDLLTPRDHVQIDELILPWNGTVPLL